MRIFFTFIIFMILFCFTGWPSSASAQGLPGKKLNKNYLRWEVVEGAVSYAIQIKDIDGNLVLNTRTRKSEHYFVLKPGTYQVRIGAVNRFEKVVSWSDWSPLIIKQPIAPVISSVEPDKLPSSSNMEVIIRGKNFEPGASVVINTRGKSVRLEECRVKDDDLVACRIMTGPASEGSFSLVVTNPGGISDTRNIAVYRPSTKEKDPVGRIYLQGGYQFVQVLDKWQAPLNHGYYGFFFRSGVPLSLIPLLSGWRTGKYFYLEGSVSYAHYSSRRRDGIVKSALHQLVPGLYLAASLPLARSQFYLQFRAGGGMAWHILVREWTFGSPETSQRVDAMMGCGAALSYQWIRFTVFTGIDYQLLFTGINLNHSLVYRAGVGYRF